MRKVAIFVFLAAAAGHAVFAQKSGTSTSQQRQRSAPTIKNSDASPGKGRTPALTNPNARSADTSLPPPPPLDLKAKAKEDEVIKVETNLVTTPVSVLDRNGRFIPGLKKKDFKILENGVPQAITYFQSEEQPFTVILMIDTSPSTKYKIDEIHYAAITFVNQLRPNDKVMVMAFDQRLKLLCEPTGEKPKLYSAIYRAQFGSGTSIYDAVDIVSNLDLIKVPGRKAVVLFTDGVDTTSRRADYASSVAGVEEIDALFYPIRYNTQRGGDTNAAIAALSGVRFPQGMLARLGRGQSEAEYEKGRLYLETLATYSGGRMFESDTITNLEASFAGVAEELRRQYSVGYYPVDTGKPGERRQLKVKVTRPKVVVRAKTSYIIKKNFEGDGEPASVN